MEDLLKEAYGSCNSARRSAMYRSREELGIDIDGKLFFNI